MIINNNTTINIIINNIYFLIFILISYSWFIILNYLLYIFRLNKYIWLFLLFNKFFFKLMRILTGHYNTTP